MLGGIQMLRSAVIGLGDIGPVHVKAIKGLPGAQLAAVCDIDQALRPQDTKLPFFTDYRLISANFVQKKELINHTELLSY